MTAKKTDPARPPEKPGTSAVGSPLKALPKEVTPGAGPGRVDVTGIMPEGVRVDPDLTEGHPGYQESGGSEIIPNERLTKGEGTRQKESG